MKLDKEFEELLKWANAEEPLVFKSNINIAFITLGVILFVFIVWIVIYFTKSSGKKESDEESSTTYYEPTGILQNMKHEGNQTRSTVAYMSPKEPPREESKTTPEYKSKLF